MQAPGCAGVLKRCREAGLLGATVALFRGEGINDSIVFDDDRLDVLRKYIADNPRRLLIKRMFPDLFRRHLSVSIDGDVVDYLGNMFLLRRPMMAVHLRRRWNDAEKEQYKAMCISAAAQGIVPVSPFVSPVENEIRTRVLDAGGADAGVGDCLEGRAAASAAIKAAEIKAAGFYHGPPEGGAEPGPDGTVPEACGFRSPAKKGGPAGSLRARGGR